MYHIQTLDAISPKGLAHFNTDQFAVSNDSNTPHAILLRSKNIHQYAIPDSIEVIGRAGAGTNNIPIDVLSSRGIPVFNTPGANANAVKELVLTGLLLASRHICQAWDYTRQLTGDTQSLNADVEKNKKQFTGHELPGKTLGIIGLGNIGVNVANAAHHLGMNVIGYDPHINVHHAWQLNSNVVQADTLNDLLQQADYLSIHVPLLPETQHLINSDTLQLLKKGCILLNFSRAGIVDSEAVKAALNHHHLGYYVSDFPDDCLHNHPQAITLPHLGASTIEAQENCADMIAQQTKAFLLHGDIVHSVNFPRTRLQRTTGYRITVSNSNQPNMVAQISSLLSKHNINIIEMINKSREDIAYNIIDTDQPITDTHLQSLQAINGILKIRNLQ